MIERRRNTAKTIDALPFVVPEGFDAQYLADNGMVNIVEEFDADESLTKRFSYAVHSCANSEDGVEPLVEIGYEDKSIPTNPYPYFVAKPALRHYLPDIEGATYKVMEKLTDGSWNQLTIGIEDATCTYENPIGSGIEFTFNAYGHGRSYVDFTVNSTHRYVVVYGASTEAVIPMDTVWFFLAGCNNITSERYRIRYRNQNDYFTLGNSVCYIHLREGCSIINDEAFLGCRQLNGSLDLTSFITIGNRAFEGAFDCEGYLKISASVTTLGNYCFYNCKLRGEVIFNFSGTLIPAWMLRDCIYLEGEVIVPPSVEVLGSHCYYNCKLLSSIDLSETSITSLSDYSLAWDVSLQRVLLPPTLLTINSYALYGCAGLQLLELPASVAEIGAGALGNCSRLTTLTVCALSPPSITAATFNYTPISNISLYVPAESVALYSNAAVWGSFGQILPIEEETT